MAVFNHPSFDEHEQVVFCHDKASGLKAIIAVHNTNLGPAFGGTRMWNYASDEEALNDVLRLSKGMTYKNAMAGLTMGGGKSVIIADPKNTPNREALFTAFGRFVNSLGGRYVAAEDVGTTPADIKIASSQTPFVAGLEGKSGDPSPFTALGTYLGIKAAVKHQLGRDSLSGLRIAVQGVGHVGYYLCQHLHREGAKLIVTDIHQPNLERVANDVGATVVAPQDIYAQDVDVYAPCALGATINDVTLPQLKAKIIAGCANNQLAEMRHAQELQQRGILYAPDYVINAGGIINVSFENQYDTQQSTAKVEQIYDTLLSVFSQADAQSRTTADVADEMARALINRAK
ncbi:Glu/Leu/Phe/Val dehydrogenase dimerization domain-containing protein [Shewanella sp.]|uniref:Glu/Leu/Phe/Val dehydrogenase dimerization domain-containing protein n=1 Tax=Shewanella sp. TaxID=50422 RepID=UPI003A972279